MCDPRPPSYDYSNSMQQQASSAPPPKPKPPEERLAYLLNTDLNTQVSAREMRLFIVANWKLVCAYAHSIHENSEARP